METGASGKAATFYDVIIVGAGISGINAAHYLQLKVPNLSYTILESRSNLGGTWDLFRYPGIRSDSDLHTFGFGWDPWEEKRLMADGESITRYLRAAAEKEGIDRHMQFGYRVVSANWMSKLQSWELDVELPENQSATLHCRFMILGTGYYDYNEPLRPEIPGLHEHFKGTVVHPQFWPKDLDYTGKRVVIIGSGATAVTLLPSMAKKAGHVTMLQRSPGYIMSVDNATGVSWLHRLLPASWSFKLSRVISIWMGALFFYFCRAFPSWARSVLQGHVAQRIPKSLSVDPHFQPVYNPWDQRLCLSPNGDYFECMGNGHATVETGHIESMTEDTIVLESGKLLQADIIVTATGLKLGLGGQIKFSVDGDHIDLADRYAWRSALLQDVPNLAFMIGYINASWTLGAETSAQLVCRLLRHMHDRNLTSVVPRLPKFSGIQPELMWNLRATYVKQGKNQLPTCGNIGPWRARTNYLFDLWRAQYGSITEDLQYFGGKKTG